MHILYESVSLLPTIQHNKHIYIYIYKVMCTRTFMKSSMLMAKTRNNLSAYQLRD